MFVHLNGCIVNTSFIKQIKYEDLIKNDFIIVEIIIGNDGGSYDERVTGAEAYNIVMALCPAALEGKQAQYHKNAWAIHNLIGHPLMQVLSWLHLPQLGIKIHDATVPTPITK